MESLKFFLIFFVGVGFSIDQVEARRGKSSAVYKKSFTEYSVKNVVKAKSKKAKRAKAALEEGGVLIEYTYSKKKVSGDKHSLMNLEAVVMQKISDNFVKEPVAHLIPSAKVGRTICAIEGHEDFFRTRVQIKKSNKPSYVIMMSDRFNYRILQKDLAKKKLKNSKVDPNEASEILITKSFLKSVDALCAD